VTRPERCRDCGRGWDEIGYHARGLCGGCYRRAVKRDALGDYPRTTGWGDGAAITEDVSWLAETGAPPVTWAQRTGTSPDALRHLLIRHGRQELAKQVKRRYA
jgi:hypothetical protein